MRWTYRQHLQMAQHLDAKASLAVGEKKLRLEGLAAAGRLLASMALKQESGDIAGRLGRPDDIVVDIPPGAGSPAGIAKSRNRAAAGK